MPSAFLLIKCESDFKAQIIEQLEKIDEVNDVKEPYGSYDIMAKLEAKTNEIINDAIKMKIGKIKNIRSSVTMLALD